MEYKINKKSIIKNLSFSFFLIIVGLVYQLLSDYFKNFIDVSVIWTIILGLLLVVILLVLDYVFNSTKGEININSQQIIIKKDQEKKIITKEQIDKVSPSWNRKSTMQFLPFEPFHFVEIKLKEGDTIYITSLSDDNLYENIRKESLFKGIVYLYKKGLSGNGSLINSIFWKRLN